MRTHEAPLVTVLLPTFARCAGGYLQRSIESVLAQTHEKLELIVSDDGSTDGSATLIDQFSRKDSRVKHIRLDKNVGLPALTTAAAFLKSEGDFIVMTFDDCTLRPNHLAQLLGALSASPEAVMAYGQAEAHWKDGTLLAIGKAFDLAQMCSANNHVPNAGVMLRRSAVDRFGWYDPHVILKRFCDWDLWLRIGRICPPVFVPEVLCDEHGVGLSTSLGNRVTVFPELMLRYSRTFRNDQLQPSLLSSCDPFRVDVVPWMGDEERAEVDFLVLEHFIATGNDEELLARFSSGTAGVALELAAIRERYLSRRVQIVGNERNRMQESLLTIPSEMRAEYDRQEAVWKDSVEQVEQRCRELSEELARVEADRASLEESFREQRAGNEQRVAQLQGSCERAEAGRLALARELEGARTRASELNALVRAAEQSRTEHVALAERKIAKIERNLTDARVQIETQQANLEGFIGELTRLHQELERVRGAEVSAAQDRARETASIEDERQFWRERRRLWAYEKDELTVMLSSDRAHADMERKLEIRKTAQLHEELVGFSQYTEALSAHCDRLEQMIQAMLRSSVWRLAARLRKFGRATAGKRDLVVIPDRPLRDQVGRSPDAITLRTSVSYKLNYEKAVTSPHPFAPVSKPPEVAARSGLRERTVRQIVAIGDGLISPVELCLQLPLENMAGSFGLNWTLFLQDSLPSLEICKEADLVIMMRTCSEKAATLAAELRNEGVPLLYTTDDDIEALAENSAIKAHYDSMNAVNNILRIVSAANAVVVYSESLYRKFRQVHRHTYLAGAVSGIELYDALPEPERLPGERNEIRIGYAGSPTHQTDVELVSGTLLRVLEGNDNVVVESIGQRLDSLASHERYRHFPSVAGLLAFTELQHSRDWDLGLAPLVKSDFNEGKSDNKYRSYGAAGIPGIYTRIRPYERSVLDGVTGLLVDNVTDEWTKAVQTLVDNANLRKQIGSEARRDVRHRYSLTAVSHEYHGLYEVAIRGLRVLVVSYLNLPTVQIDAKLPYYELRRRGVVQPRFREVLAASEEDVRWADILVVIRAVEPEARDLVCYAKSVGTKTIFSWDDDFFAIPDRYAELHAFHNHPSILASTKEILSKVDLVKASTQRIATRSRMFNAAVLVAPYGFDLSLLPSNLERRNDGRVRVGYYGSTGRGGEIEPVYSALRQIVAENADVDLVFFGLEPEALKGIERLVSVPFTDDYEASVQQLARCQLDIGLAPLATDDLARAKLPTKYRDYGATRAAGVYSDIEPYSNVVQDGVTGLLTENSVEGWYQAVHRLVLDGQLRERIATAAYEDVRAHFSLDVALDAWMSAFRRLGFPVPR